MRAWVATLLLAGLQAGGTQAGEIEDRALDLINQARVAAGCQPLVPNAALTRAAEAQSQGMAVNDYFNHRDREGHGYIFRVKAQGYVYHWVGENIAAGQSSAEAVVQNWLNSPAHRRNILDCRFAETGISMVFQAEDAALPGIGQPLNYYWTQVFGTQF